MSQAIKKLWNRGTKGVSNYAEDAESHSDPRHFVRYTIDRAPFQAWVVFVAGVGFLTDAYDIFALNVIVPMLGYVYWQEEGGMPVNYQTALASATLAGSFLGMLIFGFLGDRFGRRKMYGLELITLIIGSVGAATASRGAKNSMNIVAWLAFWRVLMGIGIGADYPLSAVITAEFAPTKHRGRMLALVFWMQPIGQLLALCTALAVVGASRNSSNPSGFAMCPTDSRALTGTEAEDVCLQTLDRAWRWIVGLGAVPAIFAISFRLTIPESPRYLMDIAMKVDTAARKTAKYYDRRYTLGGGDQIELQSAPTLQAYRNTNHDSQGIAEVPNIHEQDNEGARMIDVLGSESPRPASLWSHVEQQDTSSMAEDGLEVASWSDAKDYFIVQGNWKTLLGTSLSWLFLDIPFYGLGLSYASVISVIWNDPATDYPEDRLYDSLISDLTHELVVVLVGAVLGGALFIKLIKFVSPRTIQLWGFCAVAVIFIVAGSAFKYLVGPGLILLYCLCQLAFNLGPNTTTYLIPAEVFPTRYRCTCHGISAACGKLGSIAAQLLIHFARFNGRTYSPGTGSDGKFRTENWLGHALQVFFAFMVAGAIVTWLLVPETRGSDGKDLSLEDLAHGRKRKVHREESD